MVKEEVESPRALEYKDEGNAAFKREEWDAAVRCSYFLNYLT